MALVVKLKFLHTLLVVIGILPNLLLAATAADLPASVLRSHEDAEENMKEMKKTKKVEPAIVIDYQGMRNQSIPKTHPLQPKQPPFKNDSEEYKKSPPADKSDEENVSPK